MAVKQKTVATTGNIMVAEAMRRLRMYEQLLWDELGIYPSAKITAVFEGISGL